MSISGKSLLQKVCPQQLLSPGSASGYMLHQYALASHGAQDESPGPWRGRVYGQLLHSGWGPLCTWVSSLNKSVGGRTEVLSCNDVISQSLALHLSRPPAFRLTEGAGQMLFPPPLCVLWHIENMILIPPIISCNLQ